jgi:VWFA-related protein
MTRERLFAAAVLVMFASLSTGAQQPPLFSSKTEVVRVDVLVSEKGQPVVGLRASDFEVTDNGVPQRVELASLEQIPLNLVLVFDLSNSVAGERLEHLRQASQALLGGLEAEDQAALITFNHAVTLRAPLTRDLASVRLALDVAEPSGATALVDASYAGLMVGESDVGRALVVAFSDGFDTSSWLTPASVLDTARRSDGVVYGIAVGEGRASFLRELTSLTGGSIFEIETTKDLRAIFLDILKEFRQRYLVSYSATGVSATGWHRIDVRVKGRSFTVKARAGYLAGP